MKLYKHPSRPLLIPAALALTFFATGCSWTNSSTPDPEPTQDVEQHVEQPRLESDGINPLSEPPAAGQENREAGDLPAGGQIRARNSSAPIPTSVAEFRDASEPSPRAKAFGASLNEIRKGEAISEDITENIVYRCELSIAIAKEQNEVRDSIRAELDKHKLEDRIPLSFAKAREYIELAEELERYIHNGRQHRFCGARKVLAAYEIAMGVLSDLKSRFFHMADCVKHSWSKKEDISEANSPFFKDMDKRLEVSREFRKLAQRTNSGILKMKELLHIAVQKLHGTIRQSNCIELVSTEVAWLGSPEFCLEGQSVPDPENLAPPMVKKG